jgi:inosose dehydratase
VPVYFYFRKTPSQFLEDLLFFSEMCATTHFLAYYFQRSSIMDNRFFANAPCSWGIEFAHHPQNPPWKKVMQEIADSGYTSTELGPYGYFPTNINQLREALVEYKLSIVAGTLFQHLSVKNKRSDILEFTRKTCSLLQAVEAPYLVIIDHVASPRTDQAGQQFKATRLPQDRWNTMIDTIRECASICLDYGISPVLHPHTGGYLEFEDEIDRAMTDLMSTDIKLCIDTGHTYYAGMNPAALIRNYGDAVEYMHFKDVNNTVHKHAIDKGVDFYAAVELGVFSPLGFGDINFNEVKQALDDIGYQGWITIEQDGLPISKESHLNNARMSREFLEVLYFDS